MDTHDAGTMVSGKRKKVKQQFQHLVMQGLKWGARLSSGSGEKAKLLILIYHRVLDEPDDMRPGEVDKQAFNWQMALLSRYFNVLPLDDALMRLHSSTLPSRAVSITFDDGYADNLHNALPILLQYDLKATFFIASGYLNGGRMWNDSVIEAIRTMQQTQLDLTSIQLGRYDIATPMQKAASAQQIIKKIKHLDYKQRFECTSYIEKQASNLPDDLMLTSEQLKYLYQSGMGIGGHTVTHPIIAKLTDPEAFREITENKQFLEQMLETSIRYFAYPNGKQGQDYLPIHTEMIKTCGYQAALSTEWGVADKTSDLWQLPRFTPWDKTPIRFMIRIIAKYLKS